MFDFPDKACKKYFLCLEESSEILFKKYIVPHVKHPLLLSDFNETGTLSTYFFLKITQTRNSMQILSVGAELFHADHRQTDRQTDRQSPRN